MPRPSQLIGAAASGAARSVRVEAAAAASESSRLTSIAARSARDEDPQSVAGHAPDEATRAAAIGGRPVRPWDCLHHRGRSCRVRQPCHLGPAPAEPSHNVAPVASADPGRVASAGTALPVTRVAVGSTPDVCAAE
jgi:hypothetical protein